MRFNISKNLIRILGIPTIMVSPIGKIFWFFSLKYILKNNIRNLFYGIVILSFFLTYGVLSEAVELNYSGFLDLAIIINFLIISALSTKEEWNFNTEKLRVYFMPFLIFVLISFLIGNVFIYDDYGQPRVVLGFGPATASILFALLVIIFWQDTKVKFYSIRLILSVVLLLLSGGRTPIAVAGLIVLLTLFNKTIRRKYAIILIIFALVSLYYTGFVEAVLARSNINQISSLSAISTSGRTLVWSAVYDSVTFDLFRVSLGHQIDILDSIRPQIGFSEDQYHSELLRMYVIFGLSGVIWYVLILALFTLRIFICQRPIMSSCICALLLIGITDNTLVYLHFWALLYLCAERSHET